MQFLTMGAPVLETKQLIPSSELFTIIPQTQHIIAKSYVGIDR